MGSRFLVSGCQLGMIKGLIQVNNEESRKEALNEIEKIISEQYTGSSDNLVSDDCKILMKKGNLINE